ITGGSMELRLLRPVFPKDTLTVGAKIVEKNEKDNGMSIKCDVWIRNQDNKDIIVGYTTIAC
ncbi:MAG: MaoC family dehydratase, partial [Deltaproteobacteria bacterium]|nr:MaoC family dehydratase [Deltaproteobacteria bacterium]